VIEFGSKPQKTFATRMAFYLSYMLGAMRPAAWPVQAAVRR
jgi:hypothetical protein